MKINKDAVYTIRGFKADGSQFSDDQHRKTTADAAAVVRFLLDTGCNCVDVDVMEKPA